MSDTKPEPPEQHRLLAANMWAIFNFGDPNERYQKFLKRGRPALKMFVDGVLLHDKIVVPTQDFLSLSILVGVLGERATLDLLEAGCLEFLRLKGAFAYIGNGGGLHSYQIGTKDELDPFCAPIESAISWALSGLTKSPKDLRLPLLVAEATNEVTAESVAGEIRHETYMDVLQSPYLRSIFALRSQDMDRLAGIGPKEVRCYGGPDSNWRGDEIDTVLSLASANVELYLAQRTNCNDSATASPAGHLLKAKAERALGGREAAEAFVTLSEIADTPDIGEGVLEKQIPISEIISLRESRNGEQFRAWFHENCRRNPMTTAKEYAKLLRDVPHIKSFPLRVLRFLMTTAVGAMPGVGAILGPVTSTLDSFFLEKWLRGSSPKFFIEDLRQFQGKPK